MNKKEKREIRKIMKEAEECSAWTAAIMLAKLLNDTESANKFVDKLVDRMQWHIPFVEREEGLVLERQKIRAKYLGV
ncbi:hypothetical protein KAU40_00890 [Candidatus Parcubacteria bacterium]|nr:hypothetical protein [Candidatus Parcubacteria bacterium]